MTLAQRRPRSNSAMAVADLAAPGRLIELSGRGAHARLSMATHLLRRAQLDGETTAWIQPEGGALFPPDLATAGIDLDALVVLHLPTDQGPGDLLRAAEWLLRSGGYGFVAVDLSGVPPPRGQAWSARLLRLARDNRARLVFVTDTPERQPSLGPLIGLRLETQRSPPLDGRCTLNVRVIKNKSGGPVRVLPETWQSPEGLP